MVISQHSGIELCSDQTWSLAALIATFYEILDKKESATEALRHPVLENSFPLGHNVQAEIVEVIDILVINCKQG